MTVLLDEGSCFNGSTNNIQLRESGKAIFKNST